MDPNSTPQTVAQAVQAATQQAAQQQAQLQQNSPQLQAGVGQNSAIDNLTCQWQGCGERCDSAESLYDHVCERHVGRKSTNNLNLTCQWGACRTTTVKRDHITSHIRVHVPLKPHKCDFCGKAFKRPQDLKKHVKTHADDSVLMNSPSGGNTSRQSLGGGMGQQTGKTGGYFPSSHDNPMGNPYAPYQSALGGNPHYAGQHPQTTTGYAAYGSVSYPQSASQDIQSMDTRRRAIEALNDFLGDIKRRAIDPHSYYDVGSRLQGGSLPLPVGNGYNTGYNNSGYNSYANTASLLDSFNHGVSSAGDMHGGVATAGYSLPLPNARTKGDLQDIDRFLEQLQATVYESSSAAAAAGEVQHGVHTMHTGLGYGMSNNHDQYRSSHSPTSFVSSNDASGVHSMSGVSMSQPQLDTPVLTPASTYSYSSSGHSPVSSHSRTSIGSGQMYPNLPAVTGISDLGSGYSTTTSAPASSLASGFEGLDGRRYSHGRLQRQAPASIDTEMKDAEDSIEGPPTPKASDSKRKALSSIDPALRDGENRSRNGSESAASPVDDKQQEAWVQNMRAIESLRNYIGDRLKNGQFESEDSSEKNDVDEDSIKIAKLVEEKLANAIKVEYPSLPSA